MSTCFEFSQLLKIANFFGTFRRRGVKTNGFDTELFLQPFSVPKPPERFYFSFGAASILCFVL